MTREVPPYVCPVDKESKTVSISFRTSVKEMIDPKEIARMMELDLSEKKSSGSTLSQEDRKFLSIVSSGVRLVDDGHYEMPLPFRELEPNLPNNKYVAVKRLMMLKRRFAANDKYHRDYVKFMEDVIEKGLAEPIPESEIKHDSESVWHIPHHGVYHPKKPGKIRVVFDCSAVYQGVSLNSHLLQGPDLTNGLVGVLCRFRKEPVAFMCDIQQMFYQFRAAPEHQDFLWLLWCKSGDHETEPIEYKMKVRLFGAVSSPGCANFGLKQTANDNEEAFGFEAANFVRRDFYVDDGLRSTETVQEAVQLIKNSRQLCSNGGLKLRKFVANKSEVLANIPSEGCADEVTSMSLMEDATSIERALGVHWCVESDTFKLRIILKDQPLTRRGILSTVSSIYDPLGFVAPVILVGKQILQKMYRNNADWDSPLPDDLKSSWENWRQSLHHLETLRCFKLEGFGKVVSTELHHFSDASTQGYGQCSYIRLTDESNRLHCSLVMVKARVAPIKPVTIPRLELTAAVVSVKVSEFLQEELELENVSEIFWSDSKVVLGYIRNETRSFHVFVENRVQRIREHTEPSQWRYVKSEDNPADAASRGQNAADFVKNSTWIEGPDVLWESPVLVPEKQEFVVSPEDPEVKDVKVLATGCDDGNSEFPTLAERLQYFSSWYRLTRAIANCRSYIRKLKAKVHGAMESQTSSSSLTVEDLREAEQHVLCVTQREAFLDEISELEHSRKVKAASPTYRLDPFLDESGVLRVGGSLKHADIASDYKYPAILPRKGHVTDLIIRHFHQQIQHQGRGLTINEIRRSGAENGRPS